MGKIVVKSYIIYYHGISASQVNTVLLRKCL
jgi:hypothetical protein